MRHVLTIVTGQHSMTLELKFDFHVYMYIPTNNGPTVRTTTKNSSLSV